jgi:hypothetical protein
MAVSRTFNIFCLKNYKNHEKISKIEYQWMEKCSLAGQQYLKEKDSTFNLSSYDYKSYYGLILNSKDLKIPTKQGKEFFLKELEYHLKPGYYRVEITCENDEFLKIFTFSKHNVYLDISLSFALKYQKQFDVKINLIIDDLPNAYLYNTYDMVTINSICKLWFDILSKLKVKFPKNRLIKHLISSAWSTLNSYNIVRKTYEEILSEKLNVSIDYEGDFKITSKIKNNHNDYYELLNLNCPYKFNIRLKPYVTGYGRNLISKLSMKDLGSVVRVYTDCVSFDKPMNINDPNIVFEEKSSGMIYFKNNCNYKKVE